MPLFQGTEVQLSDYLTARRTVLRSRWELWKPWTAKVATRIPVVDLKTILVDDPRLGRIPLFRWR